MSSIFEKFGFAVQAKKEEVILNNNEDNNKVNINSEKPETTSWLLKTYGDKIVDMFCKNYSLEGLDKLEDYQKENPDEKYIISSSHTNNLDAPAVLKTFGDKFKVQLTGESVLLEKLKYLGHRALINLGGRDNFTALDYKEDMNNPIKHGSFNPENFNELEEKMNEGKTPWLASAPFALDGKMKKASIGPVYLAAKTGASIIPTALEISGGSLNLEGAKESVKNLVDRSKAIYHIGLPIKMPALDISIIDQVLEKRKKGVEISQEELLKFSNIHNKLKEQAEILGQTISLMMPEENRGYYALEETKKRELNLTI